MIKIIIAKKRVINNGNYDDYYKKIQNHKENKKDRWKTLNFIKYKYPHGYKIQ